jgi:hypothetical protein
LSSVPGRIKQLLTITKMSNTLYFSSVGVKGVESEI